MVVEQGGFTLNYGYHYILGGKLAVHKQILDKIGKPIEMVPSRIEAFYQFRRGGLHPLSVTPSSKLMGLGSKFRFAATSLRMLSGKPEALMDVPLRRWVREMTNDPHIEQYFLDFAQAVFFTVRPEEVSAGRFLALFQQTAKTMKQPSLFPVGTWRTMFEAFQQRIREGGGEVRTKAAVERVEIEGGRVTGVWSGGELIRAGATILAVPPQHLAALLPDGLPGVDTTGWDRLAPTAGVSLDLGVEGISTKIAALDLPENRSILAVHSTWDPSMAPPGHQLIQGIRFMEAADVARPEAVEAAKVNLLADVERFFPGATQRSVLRRFLIRPILTSVRHTVEQRALPVTLDAIPNLLFVGDGTDAPGELSTVACNAAIRAAEVAQRWVKGGNNCG